jgi:limonene-1,2-epoxide hydrolase
VRLAALGLTLLLALTACGSGSGPSPSEVVRHWSAALDAYDNEQAASLFAPNIAIVQGDQLSRLRTHVQAVSWNARLPCAAKIVSLKQNGSAVEVTFDLRGGRHRQCRDPAGAEATAIFVVERGKIVLWDQIGSQIRLAH